jgi:hypothetical protein
MVEPLRMSLDWAMRRAGAGSFEWERENSLHVKSYGLGKGFDPGSKKRLLLNCFSSDLSSLKFGLN